MLWFADQSLARRLEGVEARGFADYAVAQNFLRPEVGSEVILSAGGFMAYAGRESPLSRALGLGLRGPMTAAEMDEIEEFYRRRGMLSRVELCPLSDESLRELLNERGYQIEDLNNIWFKPLHESDSFPRVNDEVLTRKAVEGEETLWVETVSRGFVEREEDLPKQMEIAAPFFHQAGTSCFLAWTEGKAVGGGAVAVIGKTAGLFSASTLPKWRGRGVQTALLQARLKYALDAGCDLATIKTAPGSDSQRNVQRAGFSLAYTKLVMVKS